MKKLILGGVLLSCFGLNAQFNNSSINFSIPNFVDNTADLDAIGSDGHAVMDMNGDGIPDLVDTQLNGTSTVWGYNESQRYWKVYLGTGNSFSSSATTWNIPNFVDNTADLDAVSGAGHAVVDMDGDGIVDLVDMQLNGTSTVYGYNESQRYWKVYKGSTSGFSSSPVSWNIPNFVDNTADLDAMGSAGHAVMDMNGDGIPDLVDTQLNGTTTVWGYNESQKYWKVYLGTTSGFSATVTTWNIPNFVDNVADLDAISGVGHAVMDMDNDGIPDLVDSQLNGTSTVWGYNESQRYWKVYKGSATGFSSSPITWNIPNFVDNTADLDAISGAGHALIDLNGDRKLDLVDMQLNGTSTVYGYNQSQRYWKVYYGTGSSFSSTAVQWNIPNFVDNTADLDAVSSAGHTVMDMNGDNFADLVDMQLNGTSTVYGYNESQRYWKVYFVENVGLNDKIEDTELTIFPNPTNDNISISSPFENGVMEIYNLIGEKVITLNLEKGINNVALANIPSGIYIVNVTDTKTGKQLITKVEKI